MFREILKIIPKLDDKDLAAMERALQTRFTKIAKSFGKGVMNVFKGGGIAGIALGFIDKLLNPLKETQEAIERTLKSSDDIATNATQFNTTAGRLFKLVQLAKATGLDQDNLFMLINKFQTAAAEAKADPSKPSSVRNFVQREVVDPATGKKTMQNADTAEAFFEFIQSLQKMDRNQQLLVQQQVFGEKQVLKMADFLQTDFGKKFKEVGLDKITSDKLTKSIDKLAGLNDLADALEARRNTTDIVSKAGVINEGMIRARDSSERQALQRENQRIASYENLAKISQTADKIAGLVEQGVSALGALITKLEPFIKKVEDAVDKILKSPVVRGVKSWFGGGDD